MCTTPHYRSQKLPDDWNNGPVKTLVQSNIISVSHDPSKAVLVEFFAPWCGICQRLEPVYNLLGTHFENHSDVFVAKIDATLNEIPSIPIRSFPTIMLFPKGENIQPIVYGGNRTLESLIMFIKSEGISESAIVDKDKSIPTDEKESVAVPAKEEL
ncbi:hypothetical protein GJ496_002952 [Pomphorhynchus laevis]|nr:hypothetical protein GJ496_002952 [Pomphorhynchus laevis]